MNASEHAMARCQQRGIPSSLLDVVLKHGTETPKPGGVVEYQLRKVTCGQLKAEYKRQIHELERAECLVVVMGTDGTIVTVYHRTGTPRIGGSRRWPRRR